jgi:hypothetical protein
VTGLATGRVSPFGHPGITAHVQLPQAYRSLSRPSSPLDAKASAVCLIAFDLMFSWPPGSCDRIGRPVLIPHTRPSPKARTHHPSSIVKEHGGPRRVRHTAVMQVRTRESAGDFRGLSSAAPLRDIAGLTRRSRKEVIQPQVPLRLPCYDFAPVTELTFDGCPPCGLAHRLQVPPASMA